LRRILLVDDETLLLEVLADILAEEGYEVRTATDGREALHALARDVPDLLVTDIMMPELSGWALLEQVRRQHPTLPVLLCSAVDPRLTGRTEHIAAHTGFLAKPFGLEAFLGCVSQLLECSAS
jgi:CheY-like chemotaxis protein